MATAEVAPFARIAERDSESEETLDAREAREGRQTLSRAARCILAR
jgi:hypothetical protein